MGKKKYVIKIGLLFDLLPVLSIAPVLDLIGGRPADVTYSKFGGISKLFYQFIIK